MCGIIGIIGYNKTYNYVLEGLKQLQNRGYDSAGMCLYNNNFKLYKYISDEKKAIQKMEDINENSFYNIGIGHTRWATHGGIKIDNCHPHLSNDGNICVIHNGIIENYKDIKNFLINEGFTFYSETDTEIICNLISYYNKNNNILQAIKKSINLFTGTWGLVILKKNDNRMYFTRKGSPLLVGINEEKKYAVITSEKSGFCNKIKEYIVLDNNDICYLENNNRINFFSEKSLIDTDKEYVKFISNINNTFKNDIIKYDFNITDEIYLHSEKMYNKINNISFNENNTPGKFIYWTLKEIEEQTESTLRALGMGGRIKDNKIKLGGLEEKKEQLKKIDNIIFLGCGTSYNAGHFVSHYFKKSRLFNIIQVIDGADFSSYDIPKYGNTCCIFISQSGETLDLIRCLDICKNNNILTLGVINVVDSTIARETDCGCYVNSGREVGVASTKSFTSQVIVLILIYLWFSNDKNIIKTLQTLHTDVENILNKSRETIKNWVPSLTKKNSIFILGKDECYSISREASLKIKEISYIHAESSPASSLKHGPFGLLEKDFPVILIDIGEENRNKMINVFNEVKCRGAKVFTITDNVNLERENTFIINLNSELKNLLSIIPLQFLSFYLSVNKKINPDFPRNLAKVVTVE
jgi:glucosamine--fructose-6-phosphate aminotransferase (isomerizing)